MSVIYEEAPFGAKSWDDLKTALFRSVRRRFYFLDDEDVHDAVSEAITDLWQRWMDYSSSLHKNKPKRNYAYAVTRGKWVANEWLRGRTKLLGKEAPHPDHEHGDPDDFLIKALDEIAVEPGPDVLYEEDEEQREARAVLSQADDDELQAWLGDLLSGDSASATARRKGCSRQAVMKRRNRGLRRFLERVKPEWVDALS